MPFQAVLLTVALVRAVQGEEEEELSFTEELRRMKSVLNRAIGVGALAVVVTSMMTMAINPILAPHLSSRCSDLEVLDGEHFSFDYSVNRVGLIFASGSVAFLPLSAWAGVASDAHAEDFAWLRRIMAFGLVVNAIAFALMGPAPVFNDITTRQLESLGMMVLSQMVLGVANACTLVSAFPYIEGVCKAASGSAGGKPLTDPQRIAIAGVWYNFSYSTGCALGPIVSGFLHTYVTFPVTLCWLASLSLLAAAALVLEGATNTGSVGGFWSMPLVTEDTGSVEMGQVKKTGESIFDEGFTSITDEIVAKNGGDDNGGGGEEE